jgi:hypothetical protein
MRPKFYVDADVLTVLLADETDAAMGGFLLAGTLEWAAAARRRDERTHGAHPVGGHVVLPRRKIDDEGSP